MNWGADFRTTSNIPNKVSLNITVPPSICSLQFFIDSPGYTGHNFLKFLKHKINALNRVKAGTNGFTQKIIPGIESIGSSLYQRYDIAKLGKIANTSNTPNHVL